MPLHLVNSKRLATALATGTVSAKEQAQYLAMSFVLWAAPAYLFVIPGSYSNDRAFTLTLWFYEGVVLCLLYVAGTFFCLRKCRVDPQKHFLIDFGCLYAPISLTTLVVTWGAYHGFVSILTFLALNPSTASAASALEFLYGERFADVLKVTCVTGSVAVVFYRIGARMQDIAEMRSDG
jgi:hypothetical protein